MSLREADLSHHLINPNEAEKPVIVPAVPADAADKADDQAPYFAIVLVPGWSGRP